MSRRRPSFSSAFCGADFCGGPFRDDASEVENGDLVREAGHERHIVLHEQQCHASRTKTAEELCEPCAFDAAQTRRWLIEQQYCWIGGQRSGELHRSLLAQR